MLLVCLATVYCLQHHISSTYRHESAISQQEKSKPMSRADVSLIGMQEVRNEADIS